MSGWQIRPVDPTSPEIVRFREELITQDQHGDPQYVTDTIPYQKGMNEEIWKFSHKKWTSMEFTQLYAVFIDGEVTSVSGCKLYRGEALRMGMLYYTLKRFRPVVRSPLWVDGGFVEHMMRDHPAPISAITIYPHNRKLQLWCDALHRRTRYGQIGTPDTVDMLSTFQLSQETTLISGVQQYVLWKTLPGVPIYDERYVLEVMSDR